MSGSAPNVNFEDASEIPSQIEAKISNDGRVIIDQIQHQDELRSRGFGEKESDQYILKPFEALYLKYTEKLSIPEHPNLKFETLFELLQKHDRNILAKFLVYRDLRSRGYVAKDGFGFGNDFRVYDRGDYQKKPAKYVVFGINEGVNVTAKSFASSIKQVEKMGKDAIVAVIERRGEVIYYKAASMRFPEITRLHRSSDVQS